MNSHDWEAACDKIMTRLRDLDTTLSEVEQLILERASRPGPWSREAHTECARMHEEAARLWAYRESVVGLLDQAAAV
jgi:hypothetical protein